MVELFANSRALIRLRILWHLIWVCTVCQLHIKGSPVFNWLRVAPCIKGSTCIYWGGNSLSAKVVTLYKTDKSFQVFAFTLNSTMIHLHMHFRIFYLYQSVLMFYGPVNPMGSCRARSVYLTTCLLGRLSPLSG